MPEPNLPESAVARSASGEPGRLSAPEPGAGAPAAVRISGLEFRDDLLVTHLSDGRALCVPVAVSAALAAATPSSRLQWRISGDGQAVFWYSEELKAHLSLREIVAAKLTGVAGFPARDSDPASAALRASSC